MKSLIFTLFPIVANVLVGCVQRRADPMPIELRISQEKGSLESASAIAFRDLGPQRDTIPILKTLVSEYLPKQWSVAGPDLMRSPSGRLYQFKLDKTGGGGVWSFVGP